MKYQDYTVFEKSVTKIDGKDVFMANGNNEEGTVIIADGGLGFAGKRAGDGKVIANIPDVGRLTDAELPVLFDNNDARQLIHITYGLILTKKKADGSFAFKDALYKRWRKRENVYNDALIRHIGKHLDLLGVKQIR